MDEKNNNDIEMTIDEKTENQIIELILDIGHYYVEHNMRPVTEFMIYPASSWGKHVSWTLIQRDNPELANMLYVLKDIARNDNRIRIHINRVYTLLDKLRRKSDTPSRLRYIQAENEANRVSNLRWGIEDSRGLELTKRIQREILHGESTKRHIFKNISEKANDPLGLIQHMMGEREYKTIRSDIEIHLDRIKKKVQTAYQAGYGYTDFINGTGVDRDTLLLIQRLLPTYEYIPDMIRRYFEECKQKDLVFASTFIQQLRERGMLPYEFRKGWGDIWSRFSPEDVDRFKRIITRFSPEVKNLSWEFEYDEKKWIKQLVNRIPDLVIRGIHSVHLGDEDVVNLYNRLQYYSGIEDILAKAFYEARHHIITQYLAAVEQLIHAHPEATYNDFMFGNMSLDIFSPDEQRFFLHVNDLLEQFPEHNQVFAQVYHMFARQTYR
jgi:hypothetical protein